MKLLELHGSKRPLCLGFTKSYLHLVTFIQGKALLADGAGPEGEFQLGAIEGDDSSGSSIYLKSFQDFDGVAEAGGIFIGDRLLFVNGNPVGSGYAQGLLQEQKGAASSSRNNNNNNNKTNLSMVQNLLKHEKSYPMGLTFGRPANYNGTR